MRKGFQAGGRDGLPRSRSVRFRARFRVRVRIRVRVRVRVGVRDRKSIRLNSSH